MLAGALRIAARALHGPQRAAGGRLSSAAARLSSQAAIARLDYNAENVRTGSPEDLWQSLWQQQAAPPPSVGVAEVPSCGRVLVAARPLAMGSVALSGALRSVFSVMPAAGCICPAGLAGSCAGTHSCAARSPPAPRTFPCSAMHKHAGCRLWPRAPRRRRSTPVPAPLAGGAPGAAAAPNSLPAGTAQRRRGACPWQPVCLAHGLFQAHGLGAVAAPARQRALEGVCGPPAAGAALDVTTRRLGAARGWVRLNSSAILADVISAAARPALACPYHSRESTRRRCPGPLLKLSWRSCRARPWRRRRASTAASCKRCTTGAGAEGKRGRVFLLDAQPSALPTLPTGCSAAPAGS